VTWLTWRQYRLQAAIGGALLAALAALLVVTGLGMAAQWHSALVGCTASGTCGGLSGKLFLGNHAIGFLVVMTVGVPAVLGMLLGAPLVAQETETSARIFAWTQGVTRRHWFSVKAGWVLLAAAVTGGIVSALVTWWSGPNNALQGDAFSSSRFELMGIVPVGYAVFAVALGIAAGTLTARVVPAIGITLVGYVAVRAALDLWLRPRFMTAVTHVYAMTSNWAPSGTAWQLASGVVTPGGTRLTMQNGTDIAPNVLSTWVPQACQAATAGRGTQSKVLSCMQSVGFRQFTTYQPGDRYWPFQSIEAGIFVALAALLVAVTFAVINRRDA
jgi:hypothetical protein